MDTALPGLAAKMAAQAVARAGVPAARTALDRMTASSAVPVCEWWRAVFFGCDVAIEHLTTEQWVVLILTWVLYVWVVGVLLMLIVLLCIELAHECESHPTRTRRVHAELKRNRGKTVAEGPDAEQEDAERGSARSGPITRGPPAGDGGVHTPVVYHRVQGSGNRGSGNRASGNHGSGNRSVLKLGGCCSYCCVALPTTYVLSLDDDEAHARLDVAVRRYEQSLERQQQRQSAHDGALSGVTFRVYDRARQAERSLVRALHATHVPRA